MRTFVRMSGAFGTGRLHRAVWLTSLLAISPAWATTYYVSPAGSDSNGGTSIDSPWQSLTPVENASLQPADQVLFQYGGTWNASLVAKSSGTADAPIVYGAYGDASLGNPTFSGSDPISSSSFSSFNNGSVYSTTVTTPVNWVYDNGNAYHEAQEALARQNISAPTFAQAIAYVRSTPDSFYYNTKNKVLYVNSGDSSLDGHNLSIATREDAIYSNYQSNLVFQNLNTKETAADPQGYGIRIMGSTNVQLSNSTVYSAGKHSVGVIDSTGFVGSNLVANGTTPDLGVGGASAFVSYSDYRYQNCTSTWNNVTYLNANGPYPSFISHSDPGSIGAITINNITDNNTDGGGGVIVYSAGPDEKVILNGGKIGNGYVGIETDNAIISNLQMTNGTIGIQGNNTVLQNVCYTGNTPNLHTGNNGAIIVNGTNDIIRFNTVVLNGNSYPALSITNPQANASVYGNVLQSTAPIALLFDGSDASAFKALCDNVLTPDAHYWIGGPSDGVLITQQQFEALGLDHDSIFANAQFIDCANGNYVLCQGAAGYALLASLDPTLALANQMLGGPDATNYSYSAGIIGSPIPEPSSLSLMFIPAANLLRRRHTPAVIA